MSLRVHVKGMDAEGITLISPTSSDFDSLAQGAVNIGASPVLDLKPYVVIVSNQSPQTVVAYSVLWSMSSGDGAQMKSYIQFKYPDAVAGAAPLGSPFARGRELHSGEKRLVGLLFECGPWVAKLDYQQFLRNFVQEYREKLASVTDLTVELDAVIFENGDVIGPDGAGLRHSFSTYLQAKEDLYRRLVQDLEAGHPVEQVFRPITEALAMKWDAEDDSAAMYARQAAGEALQARRLYGDRRLREVFGRALRSKALVLRQRPQLER